jgi:hypothetical protein
MAKEEKTCGHQACACTVDETEEFCSAECATASETPDDACECGHMGCGNSASGKSSS